MATPETTVRDIALEQPASIRVFERFGIDYCCGGRKPLAQACEERSVEPRTVLDAIEEAVAGGGAQPRDWTQTKLEAICKHIVESHHAYIRAELPRLEMLAQKVVARHGDTRPELPQIQQLISSLGEELLQHLNKEEVVLFPYITNLERNLASCGPRPLGCFGAVRNPIHVMMTEHDAAGDAMARMRVLSGDFTPPEDACPTYRGFYQGLAEFEQDLHQHVHLENNILFPRAIELDEGN
ncbi:MAG TPA: iron-sulfur cluster repair di-iron protein, partial [Terracidiphilus sp.]|nr:iron-sulfur cluster repair di-iron protein [Terracidiphilus sp.]